MKECPNCGELKRKSGFYRNRGRNDGLSRICRVCMLAYQKEWRLKNIEKCRERERQSAKKGRRNGNRTAYFKKWVKDHREHWNEYHRDYRKKEKSL